MTTKVRTMSPQLLHGTILGFNISNKGSIEGAIVDTASGSAQINFPKHTGDTFARSLDVGSVVDFDVDSETEGGERPVYWVRSAFGEATGTIMRLNHALHGEVNGYHLEDGTFLHVKPGAALKHKLHIGDKVKASGIRTEGTDAVVLEVNGIEKIHHLGKRHDDAATA